MEVQDQRVQFVVSALKQIKPFAALCVEYGISRPTGYLWLERYRGGGVAAIAERSRRPHHSPSQTALELEQRVTQLRQCYPDWGARMLRVHFGEDDRWHGKPLHEAILAICKELGIAEAIVFRGIEGYGSGSRIRHANRWTLSKDAPLQLSIVDTEEQIAKLLPHLDAMIEEGLVATSTVEVIRYSRTPEKAAQNP
jgi:PII-like signaling protein